MFDRLDVISYSLCMVTVNEFKVGEAYSNDQVRFSLNLENLGGIRPSIGKEATSNTLP